MPNYLILAILYLAFDKICYNKNMKAVDLKKALTLHKSGWIAISKKNNKVIAHAKTFTSISRKVKDKKNIFFVPASQNYFGFVTTIDA